MPLIIGKTEKHCYLQVDKLELGDPKIKMEDTLYFVGDHYQLK
ncbi:hypothetical protein DSBG_1522 [Desulfosporosinus sp. BG]|nr:hypothetical protein DSBG_1522 [Desulfosporosinus sp. BG]